MAPPAEVCFLDLSPRRPVKGGDQMPQPVRAPRHANHSKCNHADAGGLARVLAGPDTFVSKPCARRAAWKLTRVMARRIEAAGVEALDLVCNPDCDRLGEGEGVR